MKSSTSSKAERRRSDELNDSSYLDHSQTEKKKKKTCNYEPFWVIICRSRKDRKI